MGTLATMAAAGTVGMKPVFADIEEKNSEILKGGIPKRKLGKTGVEVPCLIIGGVVGMMQVPTNEFDPAELANAALDAGINYFDTAASYGNGQSETNFGKVVARRRNEIFLSTKTGNRSYDGAMRDIEQSLKRLQTDHLDVWNVHSTTDKEDISLWGKPDGCLKAFYKMRDEKVIRFIGVTGHETAEAMSRAIEMYDFDNIVTTFNPVPRRKPFREELLPRLVKKNMGIVNIKVMGGGGGALARGNPSVTVGKKTWYWDESPYQAEATTLIRYCLGFPISCCVVGMKDLKQLAENVAAAKMKPLTRKEQTDLEKLYVNGS